MEIRDLGEFGLIDRLTKILKIEDSSVVVGFGDDCSCVRISDQLVLFTSDVQIEGRHFVKALISPQDLGWRVVSVNVSDVVACGGKPRWGFISLAVPPELEFEYIEQVYKGMEEACQYYKMDIIGGNTSSSEIIIFDLFLTGITDRFVPRSGAKEGDYILLSGYTGLSRAGMELLQMKKDSYEDFENRLIKAHTKPVARTDLADRIKKFASSCIDVSDGLAGDLSHITHMSRVKAVLHREKLPVSPDLKIFCTKYKKDCLDYMLFGGEDYQLVFTVKEKHLSQFSDCFVIGKVEKGSGIFLKEGDNIKKISEKGYQHI
ncbi:thiamine-phosphate kinase [Persephonella atlantica]|uniref:Thiamine-monophosphate kinase n=1 Tax=Persephonella atlantica TaxID=2699429 RepID=A0ABS1GF56_9AQUI|nr:thiamine-phosphate kinase [Persephonella atlantica]MBK3331555.1 thiamine-phosphate kinase [Persephonella atlantica]